MRSFSFDLIAVNRQFNNFVEKKMNTMNKKIFPVFMFLFLFGFTSCLDDEVLEMLDPRSDFLGTWVVSESCVRLNYEVEIVADPDNELRVLLYNFALTGPGYDPAYGNVVLNKINVPEQIIGDNWKVSGSGTLQDDGSISWSYYIEIAGDGSNCEADYEKP